MNPHMFEKKALLSIQKYTKNIGIFYALIGSFGILLNVVLPDIRIDLMIGLILFLSGIIATYILYLNYSGNKISILQPVVLLITGLVFLALPVKHDLAILVTIVFYLFLDGFVKSALGVSFRPLRKNRLFIYSGAFSILLAMFIVFGWTLTNFWLIKTVVCVNIFFDGIMFFNFSYGIEKELN